MVYRDERIFPMQTPISIQKKSESIVCCQPDDILVTSLDSDWEVSEIFKDFETQLLIVRLITTKPTCTHHGLSVYASQHILVYPVGLDIIPHARRKGYINYDLHKFHTPDGNYILTRQNIQDITNGNDTLKQILYDLEGNIVSQSSSLAFSPTLRDNLWQKHLADLQQKQNNDVWLAQQPKIPCPICGQYMLKTSYDNEICHTCYQKPKIDKFGNSVEFYNQHLFDGFQVRIFDAQTQQMRIENQHSTFDFWVDGQPCVAQEHKFGGILARLKTKDYFD